MAKGSGLQTIAMLGVGYIAYTQALDGKLGAQAQQMALSIKSSLGGLGGGGGGGTTSKSALLQSLIAANPNFESQMRDWQAQNRREGGTGQNWAAFRQHQIAILAPDPGPTAPPEFGTVSTVA